MIEAAREDSSSSNRGPVQHPRRLHCLSGFFDAKCLVAVTGQKCDGPIHLQHMVEAKTPCYPEKVDRASESLQGHSCRRRFCSSSAGVEKAATREGMFYYNALDVWLWAQMRLEAGESSLLVPLDLYSTSTENE